MVQQVGVKEGRWNHDLLETESANAIIACLCTVVSIL